MITYSITLIKLVDLFSSVLVENESHYSLDSPVTAKLYPGAIVQHHMPNHRVLFSVFTGRLPTNFKGAHLHQTQCEAAGLLK